MQRHLYRVPCACVCRLWKIMKFPSLLAFSSTTGPSQIHSIRFLPDKNFKVAMPLIQIHVLCFCFLKQAKWFTFQGKIADPLHLQYWNLVVGKGQLCCKSTCGKCSRNQYLVWYFDDILIYLQSLFLCWRNTSFYPPWVWAVSLENKQSLYFGSEQCVVAGQEEKLSCEKELVLVWRLVEPDL